MSELSKPKAADTNSVAVVAAAGSDNHRGGGCQWREMYRDLANSLEGSELPGEGMALLRNTQLVAGRIQIS